VGALDERYATPRLRRIVAKLLAHEAGEAPATAETLAIAEDDADGRPVLTLILEFAGAKVEAVATVRAALSALDGHRPDVLISDVGMPEEDGYALIRHLRAREVDRSGKTPAIALTGYVGSDDRARLLAAGFQLFIRKPVEPSDIVAAVASLAQGRSRA